MEQQIGARDSTLIQIVDSAMVEAARRSGPWLACRPGCTQCCIGPFPITQLDAARLRRGLSELDTTDPARAARVRQRARESADRTCSAFPGGLDEIAEDTFASADDEPCPALDPQTGLCDLYAFRPITCRVFGPPVRCGDDDLGVCELCFEGASGEEIAACAVDPDPEGIEEALLRELEQGGAPAGRTIVALALLASEGDKCGE